MSDPGPDVQPADESPDDPPAADRELAAGIASALRSCGYSGPEVMARLGAVDELIVAEGTAAAHERRLGHEPVDELVRVLLLERPLDASRLKGAAAEAIDVLRSAGVVERDGDRVSPRCSLVPHGSAWIASDRRSVRLTAGHVPGVQGASITLADLTLRAPVRRALDVGTGCGIQAVLAAGHAQHVVATDVNERALAFAAFNAALNGVADRVELRQGSWLDPVDDEEFDLVVSNPPFVISPELSYTFRDTGMAPGEPSRVTMQGAARHLLPGGHACVLVSWAEPRPPYDGPEQWADALAAEGCETDLLAIVAPREEVTVTAAKWTGAERREAPEALDRWLSYYAEQGITAVRFAACVLRRTPQGRRGWRRRLPLPPERRGVGAAQLARVIAATDQLAADDPAAPELVVSAPSDVRLTRHRSGAGGAWGDEAGELRMAEGLCLAVDLTAESLVAVASVRGGTVAELVERVRAAIPAGTDVDLPVRALLSKLARLGFLELHPAKSSG